MARLALVCLLSVLPAGAVRAADLDDPSELEAFVDGVVRPLMRVNSSPSGVVVIAHRGEVVLAKGYGWEDVDEREPVDPEATLFRPGSVSKLFTWVAVMQQVEAGRLDLDTDVNQYLEDFQIEPAFGQPITLRHIMTHTPGFEDGGLGYLIIDDPSRALPLSEAMKRYQPERVNPPGEHTAYSNYGAALAGLIVSNVTGLPFEDAIRQGIFEPLAMDRSTFEEPLPENLAAGMATSYGVESGAFAEKPFEIITSFAPAGALSSTASDMIRFAEAVRNGGELEGSRILRSETVDEMLSRQFTHDERLMGMGLGFYATDHDGVRVMGHGGDTQWFHSELGIDRDHELSFFVSFGGPGGSAVRTSFAPALYDELFPRPDEPPAPPDDFGERAGRYAGSYGFWRTNFSTIEKALNLAGAVEVAPTDDGTLVISFGGKAKQYVEVEERLFRELSPMVTLGGGIGPRLLAFQQDEAGEIDGFVLDGLPFMSLRKLPVWETPKFNLGLLGVSMLIFAGVLLRRFFQRRTIRSWPAADRSALRAAVWAAGLNLLVLVAGVVVVSIVEDRLFSEIPTLFKAWLVLPILATAAGLWLLIRALGVWKNGRLAGLWARLRYSVVTLCALFMCWFYWFWNILGFQYLS